MRKKKNSFHFQQKITELILSLGATKSNSYFYQLETDFGLLLISPYEDWIATRFDDISRVPLSIKINRWSGKWNFHPDVADQSWVDFFEQQLALIGVKNKEV